MGKHFAKMWAPLVIVFLLTSCASKRPVVKLSVYDLEDHETIDMAVALQLSHEFCDNTRRMGINNELIVHGDIFCENAEQMARTLFTEVSVVDSGQNLPGGGVAAVLTPQLKNIEYCIANMQGGNIYKMLITMEWSLTSTGGDLVWTETIEGKCEKSGFFVSSYIEGFRQKVEMTTDDLFQKTYEEIINSREIRAFAKAQ